MSVFWSWITARRSCKKLRSPGAIPEPGVPNVIVGPVAAHPPTNPFVACQNVELNGATLLNVNSSRIVHVPVKLTAALAGDVRFRFCAAPG